MLYVASENPISGELCSGLEKNASSKTELRSASSLPSRSLVSGLNHCACSCPGWDTECSAVVWLCETLKRPPFPLTDVGDTDPRRDQSI